jgi:hypothetical protein
MCSLLLYCTTIVQVLFFSRGIVVACALTKVERGMLKLSSILILLVLVPPVAIMPSSHTSPSSDTCSTPSTCFTTSRWRVQVLRTSTVQVWNCKYCTPSTGYSTTGSHTATQTHTIFHFGTWGDPLLERRQSYSILHSVLKSIFGVFRQNLSYASLHFFGRSCFWNNVEEKWRQTKKLLLLKIYGTGAWLILVISLIKQISIFWKVFSIC